MKHNPFNPNNIVIPTQKTPPGYYEDLRESLAFLSELYGLIAAGEITDEEGVRRIMAQPGALQNEVAAWSLLKPVDELKERLARGEITRVALRLLDR